MTSTTTTKKKTAKKTAAKKTTKKTTKKTATKKTAAKKTAAKKTAAKKTAAKKTAAKPRVQSPAALIARIEENARAAGVKLPRGASAAAIARLEKTLGMELPADMKAWYLAHDGGGAEFVLENRELLSLKRIADEWKIWKELLDKGVFEDNDRIAA